MNRPWNLRPYANNTSRRRTPLSRVAGLVLLISIGFGCTSMRTGASCTVEDEYFLNHLAFAWAEDFVQISDDPLDAIAPVTVEQIKEEVTHQFEGLGFQFAGDPKDADMLLSFVVATRQEFVGATPHSIHPWWGVYRYPTSTHYDGRLASEAFLAIDLLEAGTQKPLWRGWAETTVTKSDRQRPETIIRDAVSSILAHLPASRISASAASY